MANIEKLYIRNGTYYVRKRVPESLIAKLGKRELKKSLKTKDEKVALQLFPDALLEIEAELDRCRDEQMQSPLLGSSQTISTYNIKRIYSDKFKTIQAAELGMRERVFEFLLSNCKSSLLWEFHPYPKPEYEAYLNKVESEGDIYKIAGFLKKVRNEHRIAELKEQFTIGEVGNLKAEAKKIIGGDDIDESSIQTVIRALVDAEVSALTQLGVGQNAVFTAPAMVLPANEPTAPEAANGLPEGPLLLTCSHCLLQVSEESEG